MNKMMKMEERDKMENKEETEKKDKYSFFKIVNKYLHRYFVQAMGGMALGLFASLIIGTIINLLAKIDYLDFIKLKEFYTYLVKSNLPGAAIGAGVALSLKNKNMVILSSIGAGFIGYVGGPMGAFLATIVGCELGALVVGKTKVDIIVTPLVVILSGGIIGLFVGSPINTFMNWLGQVISSATELNPFLMGIVLSVLVGMILTAPISSAAICMSLPNLSPIAAGAACIGCCVNMVGFAVCSYKKNGWGGVLSVGLGTSMLQFPNIIRKPVIWLPVIISSAVLGPISTVALKMVNTPVGAGMGTSGLVGQFGAFEAMSAAGVPLWSQVLQIIAMHFIAPIVLVLGFYLLFKKLNWIKDEDFSLNRA